jgi:hypothetical protein
MQPLQSPSDTNKHTARPDKVPRGSGSAFESDRRGDSDGQGALRVRLRAAGGCNPRLGPRSGNFAGLKESRGQFHEKIGASFYKQPQPPESSYFVSDVFLCVWREGETPQRKWSLEQRPAVLSAWNLRLFRGQKKAPKSRRTRGGSAGVRNPFFRHGGSTLSRRAYGA